MDNLKKLTDKLQKFYASVESHEGQIQNWLKETKKPLHSIVNQSAILRAVVPVDSVRNTPFERFEGFRETLIENIFAALQEEFECLDAIRQKVSDANEILHKEQIYVENLFLDARSKGIIDPAYLNPCCPSLEHIITWSHDIWCYYHSLYLQISQALLNLDYAHESTVKVLTEAFKEDLELKRHVNRIRDFNLSKFDFLI